MFDRDSRADGTIESAARSALRLGAVFASSPSFDPQLTPPDVVASGGPDAAPNVDASADLAGAFAPTVADPFRPGGLLAQARSSVLSGARVFPADAVVTPIVTNEPSNLVVATDVVDEVRQYDLEIAGVAQRRGRTAIVAGALSGLAAAAAAVAMFVTQAAKAPPSVAAAVVEAPPPAAAPVEAPAVAEPEAPVAAASAPVAKSAETKTPDTAVKTPAPKKRFGKLTLKGEATRKVVWFDGKRMLGTGQRSFLVHCGMHTVAVSDKAESKDIEVPCNGEYVVGK